MCGYNHPVTQLLVVAHDVVCVCVCVCVYLLKYRSGSYSPEGMLSQVSSMFNHPCIVHRFSHRVRYVKS